MITVHEVLSRRGDYRLVNTTAHQFLELGPGVDCEFENALCGNGWTLFELDYDREQAVFLNVGADTNLFEVPFSYRAQITLARQLAYVDFSTFENYEKVFSRNKVIQLYNIGHCGSTLLHHVINMSGEAWDISEPKFLFDIAMSRNRLPFDRQVALARAGLKLLSCFPLAEQKPALVLKHFSQCTKLYHIFAAAMPESKALFMYRDAFNWCNSIYGFAQRMGMPSLMPYERRSFTWWVQSGGVPESYLEGLVSLQGENLKYEELAACAWALHMEEFLSARNAGLGFLAFRYNELMQDRKATLEKIFAYCGFDPSSVLRSLDAFDHDSHEGEETAHDRSVRKLGPEAETTISKILSNPRLAMDGDARL